MVQRAVGVLLAALFVFEIAAVAYRPRNDHVAVPATVKRD
jgi:hypothetical protein